MIRSLRLALVFLTRLPLPPIEGPLPPVGHAVPWFPVVGSIVGCAAGGVYVGCLELMNSAPAAAVSVTFAVLLTGAFHLDGLGDVADALAGGSTPERRLEIMKDSRLGTYGVAALVLALVLQVTSLASLGAAQGWAALVVAHSVGRSSALWVMLLASPARAEGLGVDYVRDLRSGPTWAGGLVGVVAAGLLFGPWGALAIAVAVVAAAVVSRMARRAVGGFTGDVLGTVEQVVEVTTLVVAAALATRVSGFPWWA